MGCRRKERLLVENIRNTTTHVCGFCLRLGCGKDFLSKILHKSALSCPLYSLTEMSLRCLALVAVCVVFISTEAVSGGDVKKAVGGTVSFRPDNLGSPITSITWKQRNGAPVRAIKWDDDGFSIPNPRFQGITTLDKETGQITLTNLKVEHSGLYTIDINSREQEHRFSLTVMEPVPKPVITIEKSSNPDVVYLRCGYNETIIWKNSAGDTLKGSKNHNPGEFITVKNTRTPGNFYTCTLKNAVSEETSDPVYERSV